MTDDLNRYELMMEAYTELKPEMETSRQAKPVLAQPTLNHVLADFGPMPDEALFLGVAYDELPVLLNLHDPIPGPLLIIGDPGTGKTALLHTIACAAGKMHQPEKLQFGALTNHPDEWTGFEEAPNNIGIFPIHHRSSEDFILSLASWAHGNKSSKQSVLLLLDDLEAITNMDMDAVQNLRWLLLRGPARKVWPIITLSTQHIGSMEPWLEAFRTRILGSIQDTGITTKLDAGQANLDKLATGSDFALREGNRWLRFWIPSFDE
ncbi:MAG TPA: AAA family ATPase [Anaerolineales bacterium]